MGQLQATATMFRRLPLPGASGQQVVGYSQEAVAPGKGLEPAGWDGREAVESAGDLARHGPDRVGVVCKIDGEHQRVLERAGLRHGPERRLQGVEHIAGAADARSRLGPERALREGDQRGIAAEWSGSQG